MASDAFTNSNSTALSSHNALWVTPTGSSTARIYNNTATTWDNDSAWYAMYWNVTAANAHYAEAVVSSGQDNIGGPAVRVQSGANSCYTARWAANTVQAGQVINGVYTAWGSSHAVTAGDVIRIEADPSTPTTFYLKKNGTTLETHTSKSTLTGGRYGICLYADANLTGIASWAGDDVAGGTAQDLDGDAAAAATATGALSHGVPLSAGATGQASATGAMSHGVPLQGDAQAAADATADIIVSGAAVIAFRSLSSAPQAGSTSVLFRQPDTLEAGDLALWCVVNKYPTAGPNTPTGYTPLAQAVMGDGGAAGADQGDVYATVFSRVCDGTEDAATEAISIPGGNSTYSRAIAYSRSAGSGWSIATASGSQGAASATWSIVTGSIDLAAGDMLLVFVAKNGDLDVLSHTGHSFSATGVTFGTFNSRAGPSGTTQGDDVAYQLGEIQVTAGSGTGPVTFGMSATGSAGNVSGGVMLVRLRATAPVDLAGAASGTAAAAADLAHGVPLQGAAAGQASGSGALSHGVPLQGSAAGVAAGTGDLAHGVPLQGAAAGSASAAAGLSVAVPAVEEFSRRPRPGRGPYSIGRYFRPSIDAFTPRGMADLGGAATGQAGGTGAISLGVTLAGAGIGQATATGAITKVVPLAGSAASAAAANGSISIGVVLAGAAVAQASAGAVLSLQVNLAADAIAQAVATASMQHGVPLTGAALAAVTAAASLNMGEFAGNATGQAAAAGQLSLSVPLSAAAVAQAQATGALALVVTLSAGAMAQASASAQLRGDVALIGAAQAAALASGTLLAPELVNLAGAAVAQATATARIGHPEHPTVPLSLYYRYRVTPFGRTYRAQ